MLVAVSDADRWMWGLKSRLLALWGVATRAPLLALDVCRVARRTVSHHLLSYVPATALLVHLSAAQQEKPHLVVRGCQGCGVPLVPQDDTAPYNAPSWSYNAPSWSCNAPSGICT